MVQIRGVRPVIRLVPFRETVHPITKYKWVLNTITIITVYLTGYGLAQSFYSLLGVKALDWLILTSLVYTIGFLVALLSHELGHLYISRKHGIVSEGPILIPAPPIQLNFIGTLGAIILTKTPPASRRALAKLGIMGPLMGFLVAMVLGLCGLYLSPVITREQALKAIEAGQATPIWFGSVIFSVLLSIRQVEGVLLFHPLLFASYVVYYVTFLNLLPIGQLDGGHVIRSVLNNSNYRVLSSMIPAVFIAVGVLLELMYGFGAIYISIGIIALILYLVIGRRGHPGVADQYDQSRCTWCIILYVILLILTLPVPLT
jgi:membrane-associated protease RseP (regulator of RpoE activity)